MKVNNFLFFLFVATFFVFSLMFMSRMNASMTDEEVESQFWYVRIIFLLDMVCLFILGLCMNRDYGGIHLVCLLWILIMPVMMYLSHSSVSYIVSTILWPLLFEATYLCCRQRLIRAKTIKRMFYLIAIIGAVYFFATRVGADHQTNTVYFCLLTLPWLMYDSDKRFSLILVGIFTIISLLSFKRSTMLSMVVLWAFYFFSGMRSRRSQIYTIIISLTVVGGAYIAFDKIDSMYGGVLNERVHREETDSGRDRELIWTITTTMIQQSSPSELVTGHGHFGVRRDSFLEMSAHNDFLEVIYDYGLVIFVLYLCLWGYVLRRAYRLYRIKSPIFLPYAASVSFFLVMSMVSHLVLYATYFNFLVMFWGWTEAYVEMLHPKILNRKN